MKHARAIATGLILLLSVACGTPSRPELQTRIETVEVQVPVRAPCPNEGDLRPVPGRVAAEHPAMPTLADGSPDYPAISRILGAKVIELFAYAEAADGQLRACARP